MKQVFKRKKTIRNLKNRSVFRYFTLNFEKFNFYMHHAGFTLELYSYDVYDDFYRIEAVHDKKYPYRLQYMLKQLGDANPITYYVTLKLTKKEYENILANSKLEYHEIVDSYHWYQIDSVTLFTNGLDGEIDFYHLPSEELEEIELQLFAAYSMLTSNSYVYSELDGDFGTTYRKITGNVR